MTLNKGMGTLMAHPKRLTKPKNSTMMPMTGHRKNTRRIPTKKVVVPFHFRVWKKKLKDFSGPITNTTPARNNSYMCGNPVVVVVAVGVVVAAAAVKVKSRVRKCVSLTGF